MGREIKRVPSGFDWPLNKVWGGFITPDNLILPTCPDCRYGERYGTGYSPEAHAVASTFYPSMIGSDGETLAWNNKIGQKEVDYLVKHHRLGVWADGKWTHPARIAEEVNRENDRPGLNSHDAINRMLLVEFRCKRLGIPILCPTCKGEATIESYPGQRAEAVAHEWTYPPEGDWWQIWETVSEGSPVSPAFESPEDLAAYAVDHPETRGPRSFVEPITYQDALAWITGPGWAPSMVVRDGAMKSGVDSMIGRTS